MTEWVFNNKCIYVMMKTLFGENYKEKVNNSYDLWINNYLNNRYFEMSILYDDLIRAELA